MKKFNVTVNGKTYDVAVEEVGENTTAAAPVVSAPAQPQPAAPVTPSAQGATAINSPMPGNILDVKVQEGDAVKKGDVVVVLEAMKMENDIVAPADGIIASVNVKKGDSVESNQPLLSLD